MGEASKLVTCFLVPTGDFQCVQCGATIHHPGACDPCGRAWEQSRAATVRAEYLATIPIRHRSCTLAAGLEQRCRESYRDAGARALAALRDRRADNVILLGDKGTGKSSLACALLAHAIREIPTLGCSGRYVSALNLSNARRDGAMGSRPILVSQACQSSLLVLDDLGQEVDAAVIREVIQDRYDTQRPTIVTSFLNREAIDARYGGGIMRRLFERSVVVELTR